MLLFKRAKFLVGSAVLLTVMSTVSTAMAAIIVLSPIGENDTWNLYEYSYQSLNWADIQADVAAKTDTFFGTGTQATLPEVRTADQYRAVAQMTWLVGGQSWVGASDATTEGTWTWQDGTEFYNETTGEVGGWTNYWGTSEPNGGTEANCAIMDTGLDPDGLTDVPATNEQRYWYCYETGISTSTQLSLPTSAPTYQMVLDPNSGRYYELITDYVNWNAAKVIAESHEYNGVQGRLAVINDELENAFAASCANNKRDVWIGLTDSPLYGGTEYGAVSTENPPQGWVWAGPEGSTPLASTDYSAWNHDGEGNLNQPSNSNGCENHAVVWDNGHWNDSPEEEVNYALVEFGQSQEVAKGFYNRRIRGKIDSVWNADDAMQVMNRTAPIYSEEVTSQTSTFNFVDIQGAGTTEYGYFRGTTGMPGDNQDSGEDDVVIKSYVTVEIPEAGTYTFGGYHDDVLALSIDRGAQGVANVTIPGSPDYMSNTPWGMGAVAVNFDAPGSYNIYCMYAENWGGAGVELAVAKGDYAITGTTSEEFEAARDAFVANAALIGDTLNGGLATKNLRQIYTQSGFTVNGTTTTDTINFVSDSGRIGGNFGGDEAMTASTAMTATSKLVVPENAGGWWTLGVGQSLDGSLTISKDGQAVAFSQVNGGTNGAAVAASGEMTWNAPTVGMADKALGAIYLEPGTYDLSINYNPTNQSVSAPQLTVVGGTFNVINATPADGELGSFAETVELMLDARDNGAAGTLVADVASGNYATINFDEEAGNNGHFGNTEYFPLFPTGASEGGDHGTLVVADIEVSAENAGFWSFCVNSDDGFGMQIYDEYGTALSFDQFAGTTGGDDDTVFAFDAGRLPGDSLATVNLAEGTYTMMLAHWDAASGAALEISCAKGEYLEYDDNLFSLLGGDLSEQLELYAAAGIHSEFGIAFDLLGDAIDFVDQSEYTGEASPKIAGDANKDGKVDGSDVTILAGNWQYGVNDGNTATWEMGDFNGDGKVDGSDVTILAGNWQYGVDTGAASVPEPGMLVLLLGTLASLLVVRRRK